MTVDSTVKDQINNRELKYNMLISLPVNTIATQVLKFMLYSCHGN